MDSPTDVLSFWIMVSAAKLTEKPSVRPAERRLVSVLSTDMVGYTAIVESLGEEKAAHFTRLLYDMLSRVAHQHGGAVRGFAGDSILAIFGIPLALEEAGLRACSAAIAIHKAFADSAGEIEAQFGVHPIMRVGICSGSVVLAAVEGEGSEITAVGNTVNLAARIQARAPEGGCLICDITRQLVEWRADLNFEGEFSIKGVTRPQKLWRLEAIRDGTTRFDASIERGLSPYVGRAPELASLTEVLEQIGSGMRVMDLVGEPGLGKTRLVFEFLRTVKTDGTRVILGHCTDIGQQVPFFPFIEIVRNSFRIRYEDEPAEIEEKLNSGLRYLGQDTAENLGLLMNLLGLTPPKGALDGLDGFLIGSRIRDLLPELLRLQCAIGLVILFVEDIHWIDGASEGMLNKLVEDGNLANLLVITTRRPGYVPAWQKNDAVHTLRLKPLSDVNLRHLALTRLGVDTLPDELIRQIAERSGGNPLFSEEILSFLIEQGALRVGPDEVYFDAKRCESALPVSMQSLLAARIEQLQPQDRAVLEVAAAIGRKFDPGLLSMVVAPDCEIGAALQRMQALDIVHRKANSSDYMFKHVLLHNTVYHSLLAERLSELHLAIAGALEERNANRLPEEAETLAHHYAQTSRSDQAFQYSVLAGLKSLGVFSHDQANRYFATALALYEKDPDCADDASFAAFLGNYAMCSNISLDVMTMIDLAPRIRPILNRIGDSEGHVLFLHHYVSCLVCNSRFREALIVQRELTEMAERLGDPKSLAYAKVNELSVSIYAAPISNVEFEAKKKEVEAALTLFDDAYLQNFYLATVGWNELTRGRVVRAREMADLIVEVGRQKNDPRSMGYGTAIHALVAVVTEDHQAALEQSEEALRLSRAEFEIAIADSSRVAALVALAKPGALEAVQAYVDKREADGCTLFAGIPQTMLGVALAQQGRIGDGLRQIEDTIARREAEGMEIGADWNRLFLCEIYLKILSGEEDVPLAVVLRNFTTLMGVTISGEKRIRTLIEKIRQNPQFDKDGHNFAHGEIILGLLCKHRKRKSEAIDHLKTAHRLIAPTGQSPMLARVEDALAELGVYPVSRDK